MAAPYTLPAGATAAEWAQRHFGGPTTYTERDVTVGTAVVTLISNNPRRVLWTVQNRSANDIATSDQRDVTTSTGFLLAASGGTQSMQVDEDGEVVTKDRFAISGAANCIVRVLEVMRV